LPQSMVHGLSCMCWSWCRCLVLQAGPCETVCCRHPEPVRACNARPPWFVPAPQRCPGEKTPGRRRSVAHHGDLWESGPGWGTGNELRITGSNSGDGPNRRSAIRVLATGPTVQRLCRRRTRTARTITPATVSGLLASRIRPPSYALAYRAGRRPAEPLVRIVGFVLGHLGSRVDRSDRGVTERLPKNLVSNWARASPSGVVMGASVIQVTGRP
jgi:hypothetical protein